MLSGEPQNQVQSGSELLPNCAEILVKTVTSSSGSSSASSAVGGSDNHTRERPSPTLLVQARNDTISTSGHDSRPPLGSRELSMDMVDEIRKLIRQEFFGAYPSKDLSREPASEDGSLSPRSTNTILNGPEKKFPYPDTVVKLHQDDRDDGSCSSTMVSEPLPTPISAPSSSSSISSPSLSLVPLAATRADPPKPAVRFSDDVPSVRSPLSGPASPPAKKAPWAMYRRTSNGEPVPEWGVLFDENGFVTARCMQVFRGLARFLAEDSPPRGAVVVTPEKLGLLYSRFKIEGEMYPFEDVFHSLSRQTNGTNTTGGVGNNGKSVTYYNRISDFYADLDCEYYLVPLSVVETGYPLKSPPVSSPSPISPPSPVFPRSSSYSSFHLDATPSQNTFKSARPRLRSARPCVPALTLDGFAQFLTICVLAHPDEEAKRLDKIVSELALVVDAPPSNSTAITTSNITPISHSSLTGPSTNRSERLPRQFVRSLLPVKADARSRRLLASAVEDLLCDLRLSDSSFSSISALESATEHSGRRSFTNAPTILSAERSSRVPNLPPPPMPMPLPRTGNVSASGSNGPSAPKALPSSLSAGSLVKFRAPSPSDRRFHSRRRSYDHRRYGPPAVHKPPSPPSQQQTAPATRFELGDADGECECDSASSDTVTTVTVTAPRSGYHGHELGRERVKERDRYRENYKDRDRNRDRDHDDRGEDRDKERERERDKGYERRPPPAPRRHSERRWSSAAASTVSVSGANATESAVTTPGADGGANGGVGVVVGQKHDDRGPTWSEVIRAQQQQQQQQQQKPKGVTFSDERERT